MNSRLNLLDLSEYKRPAITHTWDIPLDARSRLEQNCSSRRINDPVFGIRMVLLHFFSDAQPLDELPAHHIVPASGQAGYGEHTFSLVNEARALPALESLSANSDVEWGLSQPNQWSVSIGICVGEEPAEGGPTGDDWQLEAAALLVRRCWRRYDAMKYVADATLFGDYMMRAQAPAFRWKRFFSLITNSDPEPK